MSRQQMKLGLYAESSIGFRELFFSLPHPLFQAPRALCSFGLTGIAIRALQLFRNLQK